MCPFSRRPCRGFEIGSKCFPGGSGVKNLPANAGEPGSIPKSQDPLEMEMASRSSILAWEISWTEEPGGLWSNGVTEELDATWRLNKNS